MKHIIILFIIMIIFFCCSKQSLEKDILRQGNYINKSGDRLNTYYVYDFVSKEQIESHAMRSNYSEGRTTANYYFSYNGNIPSHELKLAKSFFEADEIINNHSYNIKFAFVRNPLGDIKFIDCSKSPNDDLCIPN